MKTNWIFIALLGLFTVACAGNASTEGEVTEAVDSTATEAIDEVQEVVDTMAIDSTTMEADSTMN